jgi:hypothetical protein
MFIFAEFRRIGKERLKLTISTICQKADEPLWPWSEILRMPGCVFGR